MAGKISQFPSLLHPPYVVCTPKWSLLGRHEAIVCLSHTETLSNCYASRTVQQYLVLMQLIISSMQSRYQWGRLSFIKFKVIIRKTKYFPFILWTACSRTHHLYIEIISPRSARTDKFCNNTSAAVIDRWISIWFIFISLVLNK